MTATPTILERLLALGADCTRHHDALNNLALLRGPDPAGNLARHIPTTQALAHGALDVSNALRTAPRLYHSPSVRAAMDRSMQLAALATLAADHLIDAVDILQNAAHTSGPDTHNRHGTPLLEAGRRAVLAGRLTCLGAEDCLATTRLIARELHQQQLTFRRPALSPAQQTALEAVAAGRATVNPLLDKPYVRREESRVSISTIRSLETRGLVGREPGTLIPHDERLHLTPHGCRALAAALGGPRRPANAMGLGGVFKRS